MGIGKATVAQLNALAANKKLNESDGVWFRCNTAGTVITVYRRIDGRDYVVIKLDRPVNGNALAMARVDARQFKPAAIIQPDSTESVPAATLGDLWFQYRSQMIDQWSVGYAEDCDSRIRRFIAPHKIWDQHPNQISTQDFSNVLRPIRVKQPDTEIKVRSIINSMYAYSIALGTGTNNPVAGMPRLWSILGLKKPKKHHPAILEIEALRDIIKSIRLSDARLSVRAAAEFQARTAQRSFEVVAARWDEIYQDKWTIPRDRMKVSDSTRPDQVLILPSAALALLDRLPRVSGYVFASRAAKHGHVTIEALSKLYRVQLGLKNQHVPHGWRSSFRTIMESAHPEIAISVLEHTIDHTVGSDVERAYARAKPIDSIGAALAKWGVLLGD